MVGNQAVVPMGEYLIVWRVNAQGDKHRHNLGYADESAKTCKSTEVNKNQFLIKGGLTEMSVLLVFVREKGGSQN